LSAIFGFFNTSGAPADREALEAMRSALAHRAIHGSNCLTNGPIGIGCASLWVTPEDLDSSQPLASVDGRFLLVADARIDNRPELAQALCLEPSDLRGRPDAWFILQAWQKWDEGTPEHLEGEFAVVVWDSEQRKLFCVTDHLATRSFHFINRGGLFAFSSEAKAIRALPGISLELDLSMIAGLISPGSQLERGADSYFKDVFFMPAASVLTVSSNSQHTRTYWDFTAPSGSPMNAADCMEEMRDKILRSVKRCMRATEPCVALLSGGLDSSAIVGCAAAMQNPGDKLKTLSVALRPDDRSGAVDEMEFIREFANRPDIEQHFAFADARGPFDNIDRMVWGSEEPQSTTRHYLYSEFADQSRNLGARVILDGAYAEFGPSTHGTEVLYDWFLTGKWGRLFRELRSLSKTESTAVWSLIKRRIIRPLLPGFVTASLDSARGLGHSPLFAARLLRDDFVQRHGEKPLAEMQRELLINQVPQTRHRQAVLNTVNKLRFSRPRNHFVNYESVSITYPFWEKNILDFALQAPLEHKLNNGYSRNLLRQSMRGLLPEKIRQRTTKEPFSPDYHVKYNKQIPSVRSELAAISKTDPIHDVIDIGKLRELANLSMTGNRGSNRENLAGLQMVPRAVYLISFLRQNGGI
jgi:asparagine synthase (glutamine-hydrolysing)